MRIRLAGAAVALAVTPMITSCGINIGDCVDFGVAGATVIGYQAAIQGGEMTDAEVADAQQGIADARENVPEEVQDEFNTYVDALNTSIERIEEVTADGSDEITDEEWTYVSEPFEDPAVTEASDSLEAWIDDNCVPGD